MQTSDNLPRDEPPKKVARLEKDSISEQVNTEESLTPHCDAPLTKPPPTQNSALEGGSGSDQMIEKHVAMKTDLACLPLNDDAGEVDWSLRPKSLKESDVGITEYLSTHTGFSAIIKQRYSDFLVNEVDMAGNVVHLTDMSAPVDTEGEEEKQKLLEELNNGSTPKILTPEDMAALQKMVADKDRRQVYNIPVPDDKEMRTKVHLIVKQTFTQLETKTTEVNGQKVIQALFRSGNDRLRQRDEWPRSKKACHFVKFVLYKENKDTMDAVGLLAKTLKVNEGIFQYAGTKDRRAKTTQEVTVSRIHPKKLAFMNKTLRNIGLGNFRYVMEPLKLRQLGGNQFTIVLRNVTANKETVDAVLSKLTHSGFVNYYGMQRFGTTAVPTFAIGSALLHEDWERAVDLILMPTDETSDKATFQKTWKKTRDVSKTLRVTPRYCGLERNLLVGLQKTSSYFNAIERIPRNMRLLYVHSYQALIWNQIASRRLKELGHSPVVGDLVLRSDESSSDELVDVHPSVVREETLGQYTIQDVVLPLPGHDIIYPTNTVYGWFRDRLAADGLDIDSMKRTQKDYSLPGSYRRLTVLPKDVSWTYHRYDDYTLPITLSDFELLKGKKLPAPSEEGKYQAVMLKMTLPPSCYATMALREAMRIDTSSGHQSSLNVS